VKILKLIPDSNDIYNKMKLDYYGFVPVLSVRELSFDKPLIKLSKRMFDIIFSLIVVVFILSWLTPILYFLIKKETKGPLFFKQIREGVKGETFLCYKYRSMGVNRNADRLQATKGDLRITKIGAFLRKTSIDELPQFINVLKGEMSVVGPRPHMLSQSEIFKKIVKKYMVRHFVKPGITGLAQVKGYRGEIETDSDIKNRVKYDIFYIENWSFFLDIKIILILGSGGREHAIAYKISQSKILNKLFIAPGNAGTLALGKNLPIAVTDFESIKKTVIKNFIDIVIVGPEDPLVNGIHNFFLTDKQLQNIAVIGPEKLAATLEGSKEFAKKFMYRHNIPTAKYKSFTKKNVIEGYAFLDSLKAPYVLKADGLAAGKGVLILNDLQEAKKELDEMLSNNKFGKASEKIVIEEFLDGIELSCFVLTDGENYKILPYAKDYKRISEGDIGLNTGGMGAVSPVPFVNELFLKKVEERIIKPTINGFKKDKTPYKGFVFIGLIKIGNDPFVIEYNVRMGDPETEVVFPRIKSDVVEMFKAVAEGTLDKYKLEINNKFATTVMLVSGGYPEKYEKGKEISGLDKIENSVIFHAGTKKENNKIVTNGGRVLAVTSLAGNLNDALKISYNNIEKIQFENMNFRKDIGYDL